VLQDVEGESSNVRKRQVGNDAVLRTDSFWFLTLSLACHCNTLPAEVVVAQHAALGVSGSSTGVDEAAALTRFLSRHLLVDHFVFDRSTNLEEVFPEHEAGSRATLGKRSLAPKNEGLDAVILVQVDCKSLHVFSSFANNYI